MNRAGVRCENELVFTLKILIIPIAIVFLFGLTDIFGLDLWAKKSFNYFSAYENG